MMDRQPVRPESPSGLQAPHVSDRESAIQAADTARQFDNSEPSMLVDVSTELAAASDVERSDAYAQLRASEQRLRSIFDQVHTGIALADPDGRYFLANRAFAELLGYSCDQLKGKHFSAISDSQDVPAIRQRLQALLQGVGEQASLEVRFIRSSGEPVWCSMNVSLVRDTGVRPAYFLAVVQNIDERRKTEEERQRLQQQLFQAQKMETLGTLAGGIAHDFNNLLSVILGFASLARQRLNSTDPLQESMGMIEQSAQRAADLTRQLLGFARPERQQMKPVCVDEVLERIRRMVARTFDRKISVAVHKGNDPLWVNAVPSYLEQALLNICINARDAMPDGGALTLSARAEDVGADEAPVPGPHPAGRFVAVSVQDTGAGISPDVLPRLFEPFFTTKEPGRGTGLGLAMVYGFVKNHDGFVKVESKPGRGARFTLWLPVIQPPARPPGANALRELRRGSGTILVVDDEPMVRAFAQEGLKGLGYRVLVAENGRQALQIYEEHREEIDCVLLDLIMPQMSGLETFRRMRAAHPSVHVVFASGYSTGEILRDAPDARSAAFLGKPYTLEGLSSALQKASAVAPC